ncbi:hypothetical protein [Acidiphilium iwatense]|uniref:hypothetical protein n=1 Tax=Acidiphilium iwatense TaxID=768198 RepID=UPI001F385711|nr:hypothetical protein [Acidiphilium iwatense]
MKYLDKATRQELGLPIEAPRLGQIRGGAQAGYVPKNQEKSLNFSNPFMKSGD